MTSEELVLLNMVSYSEQMVPNNIGRQFNFVVRSILSGIDLLFHIVQIVFIQYRGTDTLLTKIHTRMICQHQDII